ncbi:hypothetical protein [Burkholderia cepacia]|uniref:hypothetical protein n=1 Tax=Burkholderia cepacia TaxID=292 RepID=UPI00075A53B2|nr:hypothetical protein [Burkholderia cepacia]KWH44087.1 hypothetical protein WM00_33205 [Burkholderia cepacia]OUE40240.1 hypothetical protein BZY94_28285 [Burkholderia territorii]HDR9503495.1 hypothetical protein [Burkholderia cepacia]
MTDLVTLQAPIDYEIANSLIIATPEAWLTAEMIVTRAGERDRLEIAITNPDGIMDIVLPTKEIVSALQQLVDLHRGQSKVWVRAVYSVAMIESGQWHYSAVFEYKIRAGVTP